jgi:S-adenosylmethionine-diacylglycerol 3-amino-3-carboxypropyl transferase
LAEELEALGLAPEVLGPRSLWAEVGPDHAGRYEQVFAQLRQALNPESDELLALFRLQDIGEQTARAAPTTRLGRALDEALDRVMDLPNLVALFSAGATQNRFEPFGRHFARRTRQALATLPACTNPYLWQMYHGCFPDGVVYPWLAVAPPPRMPEIICFCTMMTEALEARANDYDFVHLSNILDWLSPEEARATLDLAAAALRPGGWVLIRQLNSTLDIAALGSGFSWQTEQAAALHAGDRSFFYRVLHLGRKR